MKAKYFLALTAVLVVACKSKEVTELQIGKWRGVFALSGENSPFNFSVEDDTTGTIAVFLTNADERFKLDSVRYERDSVIIPVEVYDALLVAKVSNDSLHGYFRKNQLKVRGIPFSAARNQEHRFDVSTKSPASSLSANGKWSVILTSDKGSRYTVGKFNQAGNRVTGTLLTTTGDYRYFDGVVDGDSLKLSAFSGSNPSLLKARFSDSLHLSGDFFSPGGKTKLEAVKSDTAKLPDPYSLTYLKKGVEKFSFSFPNLKGKPVSLEDEKYKGKAVIVTILGSWCPNCLDEAAFLSPWYKENKQRGVEIIGLSFERKDDLSFAKPRIEKFIRRFDINYDILFAGLADKKVASEKLPAINALLSFPTTIFINRKGTVTKIHTGFTGPATGEYYQQFIKEFNQDVNEALGEDRGTKTGS
jgi:peroxiredoxin